MSIPPSASVSSIESLNAGGASHVAPPLTPPPPITGGGGGGAGRGKGMHA